MSPLKNKVIPVEIVSSHYVDPKGEKLDHDINFSFIKCSQGQFGDYEAKKENDLLKISEIKNLLIVQIVQYKVLQLHLRYGY